MTPKAAICLLLFAAVLAVYGQTLGYDFVDFDDPVYVSENPFVIDGLTVDGARWAFTSAFAAQPYRVDHYVPLTFLTHMLAVEVSGLNGWAHHLFNVLLHGVNAVLLFLALERMTRVSGGRDARWKCAFVAALFAVHPQHVESVAWVTERKDVLCGLFWMLGLLAYGRYAERPRISMGLCVMLAFTLGLLSKPMVVTFPFALLLLDYWPLGRFGVRTGHGAAAGGKGRATAWRDALRLVLEKTPLFALAALAAWLALRVQRAGGATGSIESYPLWARLANAPIAYGAYIAKTFFPWPLAFFYPHPGTDVALWRAAVATLLLLDATALFVWAARQRPHLAVGWFWFLGTLLPVIGLAQVGGQAMADRYTYLSCIGLYIILAWGVPELWSWRWGSRALARSGLLGRLALGFIAVMAVWAFVQTRTWRDSVVLFQHAIATTVNNDTAHNNLGVCLQRRGDVGGAVREFEAALRTAPTNAEAHNNLALSLESAGRYDEALDHYEAAARLKPAMASAQCNLGGLLLKLGELDRALVHLEEARGLDPFNARVYVHLGKACEQRGLLDEALARYRQAVALRPALVHARLYLADALVKRGQIAEAVGWYREALSLPDAKRYPQLTDEIEGKLRALSASGSD